MKLKKKKCFPFHFSLWFNLLLHWCCMILFYKSKKERKVTQWCSGYKYCTISFIKAWTQVLCRLKSCSQRVRDCDGEDLWQWSHLKIRLNNFRWSTTPQKQFFIIIICNTSVVLFIFNLYAWLNLLILD